MSPTANTIHGARAKLFIDGKACGIFNSVNYSLAYDMQPVYILGRFSPSEIVATGQEAINIAASGFRIFDRGPHVSAKVPHLQDLLGLGEISLAIEDRENPGKPIMTVVGVKVQGYSTSINARAVQEISVTFIGLRLSDESGSNDEEGSALDITS